MRRKYKFIPAVFEETIEYRENPGRGWYEIYSFQAEKEPDFEELRWCIRKEQQLVLVCIDIGAYWNRELDEVAGNHVKKLLEFFTKHGKDIILRVTYDREGRGMEREPEHFSLVRKHLQTVGELIEQSQAFLLIYQGLLVGNWGEMHGSKFLSREKLVQLYQSISPYLSEGQFLAVRKPVYWRWLEKYRGCPLGLFDDGIFGSATHLGTFAESGDETEAWDAMWSPEKELEFEEKICHTCINGGEALVPDQNQEDIPLEQQIETLKTMHLTYLNCIHHPERIAGWKNQVWKGKGIWRGVSAFDYIGNHLGYRFVVRKATLIQEKKQSRGYLHIQIENIGFANFYQEAELTIVEELEEGTCTYPVEQDIRTWDSGKTTELIVEVEYRPGKFYLQAARKKDGRRIYFANKNADDRILLGHLR